MTDSTRALKDKPMTGIVQRLRQDDVCPICGTGPMLYMLRQDAADEIERLTKALAIQTERAALANIRAITAEERYKAMQNELPDKGSHYLNVLRERQDAVCTWAADEIERLQIEHAGAHNARDIAWEENERLKRDNATLLRTIAKLERMIET